MHSTGDTLLTLAAMPSPYRGAPETGSISIKRFSNFDTFFASSSSSRVCWIHKTFLCGGQHQYFSP